MRPPHAGGCGLCYGTSMRPSRYDLSCAAAFLLSGCAPLSESTAPPPAAATTKTIVTTTEESVLLYTKACAFGDAVGCSNLAAACDGGDAMACRNLGGLYAVGIGVSQDKSRAATLYAKGCDGGDSVSCQNLHAPVPIIMLGKTAAPDVAHSPVAAYLVAIHNGIHPIAAEEYLRFYGSRPGGDHIDITTFASLEIVLDKDTGSIVRVGVTKSSWISGYDAAALRAVKRAQPFGKAPDSIASSDGNVHLHWEFHGDPFDVCSTRNARPFIFQEAPKKP